MDQLVPKDKNFNPGKPVVELPGRWSVAVAVCITVAVDVALAVAVGFIGFGATIRTHQEIQWSPKCSFFLQ